MNKVMLAEWHKKLLTGDILLIPKEIIPKITPEKSVIIDYIYSLK